MEAIFASALAPMVCGVPSEYPREEAKLINAVQIMQTKIMKLLEAQTSLGPIQRHTGSTRRELMKRTTYQQETIVYFKKLYENEDS